MSKPTYFRAAPLQLYHLPLHPKLPATCDMVTRRRPRTDNFIRAILTEATTFMKHTIAPCSDPPGRQRQLPATGVACQNPVKHGHDFEIEDRTCQTQAKSQIQAQWKSQTAKVGGGGELEGEGKGKAKGKGENTRKRKRKEKWKRKAEMEESRLARDVARGRIARQTDEHLREIWYSRKTVHADAPAKGTASWAEIKQGMMRWNEYEVESVPFVQKVTTIARWELRVENFYEWSNISAQSEYKDLLPFAFIRFVRGKKQKLWHISIL